MNQARLAVCVWTEIRGCCRRETRHHIRHRKHLLMNQLQGIHSLLEIDVIGRELGLSIVAALASPIS